jgi:spore germination protein KC
MVKRILLSLMITMLIFVTGCWNSRELDTLAIVVGMGIDKSGDQYKVSVQVVEPSEVAGKKGAGAAPVVTYQATGTSIFEALRRITTVSPRKMYMSHLRILIFGESLAREGIGNALDFLSRDHEVRTDFYIVVARQVNAEDALKVLTHLEKIPSFKIFTMLKTSEVAWAPTTTVTLDRLITELVSEGRHPVITGLRVEGEQETGGSKKNIETIDSPVKLYNSGMAVFRGDKQIGWLNEDESTTFTFIRDEVKSTVGSISCPEGEGKISVEVIRSKTKVKGSVNDGQPRIDIEIRPEVSVAEVQCSVDLTKAETITLLENLVDRKLEDYIKTNIKRVQKNFKVDIFGFGEVIHRSDPKEWNRLKNNWDQTFINIPVTVKVTHKIRRLGTLSNSFIKQMSY